MALQFWINGVVFASFIPRLPEIRDQIGVDLTRLGLLLTLGSLGGLAGSALCPLVISRFGTRRSMVVGASGLVVVLATVGRASTPLAFLAVLMALHLFDVITDVAMNIQASTLSARRSTPVMSRVHGLWSVGTVVGGLGATVAATRLTLTVHLMVVSAVLALVLVYVAPRLLPDDPVPAPPGRQPPAAETAAPARGAGRRASATFAALAIGAIALETIPADWASVRLADDLDLTGGSSTVGFVAVTIGMVIGRFAGDSLTVALGPARLGRLAAGLSMVGLALGGLGPSRGWALAGFGLAGLGASVLFPRLYDAAAQSSDRPGAALGSLTAGIRVGAFVVPVSVGALAGLGPWTVGAAMVVVALPGALILISPQGPGAEASPTPAK